EDLGVLAAAADVPRERLGDLGRVRLRVRREEREGRHDETARADPALEATFEPVRALDRVEPGDSGSGSEARHGLDLLTATEPRRQDRAAVHRSSVDEDRARAALGAVAAEVRVREAELEVHR